MKSTLSIKRTICSIVILCMLFACVSGVRAEDTKQAWMSFMENSLAEYVKQIPGDFCSPAERQQVMKLAEDAGLTMSEANVAALSAEGNMDKQKLFRIIWETEIGDYFARSIEEAAWFDEMLVKAGAIEVALAVVPEAGEATEEEVRAAAEEAIERGYGVTAEQLSDYMVFISYTRDPSYPDERQWLLNFWPQGKKMLQDHPELTINANSKGELTLIDRYDYQSLNAQFEALQKEKGYIYDWSVEDKAWFAETWSALISEEEEKNGFVFVRGDIYRIAQLKFSIPQSDDIMQDAAVEIAHEVVCTTFSLSREDMEQYNLHISFLSPTPPATEWRITYWPKDRSATESMGFIVRIDGKTGEVSSCLPIDGDTPFEDQV